MQRRIPTRPRAPLWRRLPFALGCLALAPLLATHPRIGPFFKDTSRQHRTTQLTAQLCQLAGAPCVYGGADMKAAHRDMGVRRGDFNALVEVLQQSMQTRGIPFAAQTAMLACLAPMHRDIVKPR